MYLCAVHTVYLYIRIIVSRASIWCIPWGCRGVVQPVIFAGYWFSVFAFALRILQECFNETEANCYVLVWFECFIMFFGSYV